MGVMGLPMAKNVVQKCGLPVLGYDVVQQQMTPSGRQAASPSVTRQKSTRPAT